MANKKGLDLCYHQGNINWKQVKAAGIDFIIPRDGWGVDCDGKQTDPKFLQNVKQAQEAGIEVPGVYHFIYAVNEAQARENAANAINNVRKAGLPQSTIIWCDQQEDTVVKAKSQGYNVTTKMQLAMTKAFCDYCLEQGYCTGVYLNQDYIVRVYGKDIINQYDIWLADLQGAAYCKCLYRQVDWYGKIAGISVNVDVDQYYGEYTAGTAKPKTTTTSTNTNTTSTTTSASPVVKNQTGGTQMGKVQNYINALKTYGDGRYHYYDGKSMGIGCSEYTRLALVAAGVIKDGETFHAGSGNKGCLTDTSRFQCLAWNPAILQPGDILWSQGHHVATWAGNNSVYEAAPESTHPLATCGTGVGLHANHGYYNCGTGTNTWTCIYRIIDGTTTTTTTTEKTQTAIGKLDAFIGALPAIQSGSKGDIVKVLQTELKRLGFYTGAIDGNAGTMTVTAIKAAQKAWGINVDGSFGPQSWSKLLK